MNVAKFLFLQFYPLGIAKRFVCTEEHTLQVLVVSHVYRHYFHEKLHDIKFTL